MGHWNSQAGDLVPFATARALARHITVVYPRGSQSFEHSLIEHSLNEEGTQKPLYLKAEGFHYSVSHDEGKTWINVPDDGNCFYRAVLHGLGFPLFDDTNETGNAAIEALRKRIASHIDKNWNLFDAFVERD
jgi:hypothetical protein